MPDDDAGNASTTSLKMLSLFLDAFGCDFDEVERVQFCGLPVPTVRIPANGLLLAATPCDEPMFRREIVAAALLARTDVLLVRHGFHPEILDPVVVDHAASGRTPLVIRRGLFPFIDGSGGFWLVPSTMRGGASLSLTHAGLSAFRRPPFGDVDERHAGLVRAARAVILRQHARGP
jgi:hypothetical protein